MVEERAVRVVDDRVVARVCVRLKRVPQGRAAGLADVQEMDDAPGAVIAWRVRPAGRSVRHGGPCEPSALALVKSPRFPHLCDMRREHLRLEGW
jgi:hypothetical protein